MFIDRLLLSAGAMKAGTSYLYKMLEKHPGIETTPVKEIHYFAHMHTPLTLLDDNARLHNFKNCTAYMDLDAGIQDFRRSLSFFSRYLRSPIDDYWYANLFETGRATWKADFSNMACVLPEDGLRHIKRIADDVRVIYLLRDPLQRMWSHTKFHAAVNGQLDIIASFDVGAFGDYVEASGALAQGRYAQNITRMQRHLSPQRVKITYFEDLITAPQRELDAIFGFLGLEAMTFGDDALHEVHNRGPEVAMPTAFVAAARPWLEAEMGRLAAAGIAAHPRWQV